MGGEGGEQLRRAAEGGATVRDRSTEERRNEAVNSCVAGCASERASERAQEGRRGAGEDERPCRLLESPKDERHHLGRNTDLANAALDEMTRWADRVSRQAARANPAGRGLRVRRRDARRGCACVGWRRALPRPDRSSVGPSSSSPSPAARGPLGRGDGLGLGGRWPAPSPS